jgi:uncharacterized protein (TIGR00255 family)
MLSMTGFGTATEVFKGRRGSLEISVEIRTVNSKFLDISIRSPRIYVPLDSEVSKFIRGFMKRGRVDVNISSRVLDGPAQEIIVNVPQATEVWKALEKVRHELGLKNSVELRDLLSIPDWIEQKDQPIDSKEEWTFIKTVLQSAIEKVLAARKSEGAALHQAITGHKKRFSEVFEKVASRGDAMIAELRERLRTRIKELHGNEGLDPDRLEQEITLWIARSDFREELDRVRLHLTTFDATMAENSEQGRKLEFLVQELHREVNTMGSKCVDAATTPNIIELKTCIERIREQLQNSE